jgi:hypothetical protein
MSTKLSDANKATTMIESQGRPMVSMANLSSYEAYDRELTRARSGGEKVC